MHDIGQRVDDLEHTVIQHTDKLTEHDGKLSEHDRVLAVLTGDMEELSGRVERVDRRAERIELKLDLRHGEIKDGHKEILSRLRVIENEALKSIPLNWKVAGVVVALIAASAAIALVIVEFAMHAQPLMP